ncbi:MAG TPA: ABC transporter ATP-binding protein [Candidatus Limiplasma sp.]|nr:ABC transporter ATP-binding protein [Candidatus Limiplasma sp.]HPS80857.1 ABC transporter ATP-binding protein [Candidatus Limiplasma sp.]
MSANVLHLDNITMQFGGVVAVNNVSLDVNEGEIVALIGPNGAGKTTVFNVITGVYAPTNGRVTLRGKVIAEDHPRGKMRKLYTGGHMYEYHHTVNNTPDKITKMGMARTFQNIRLFKSMTVFENVLVAKHMNLKANYLSSALHINVREEAQMREDTMELLRIVGLAEQRDEIATSLPYGQQRRLEIARALSTNPSMLLLDEPAAGMNPQETEDLSAFIRDIKDRFSLTVLLIEHDMNLVMDISDRIYVLNFGALIANGTPAEIQSNPDVITAYLGVSEE